jgi:hypothetical protein
MTLYKILWSARLVPLAVAFVLLVQPISAMALRLISLYSQSTQEKEMTFTSLQTGSGRTEDGSRFSFWLAESSDGVAISARTEQRRSVARALGVLNKHIKGAEIVARGRKTNNQGERVGERVAGCFPAKDQVKGKCVILWTEGSEFHILESASLPHLLAFEKKYYGTHSPNN